MDNKNLTKLVSYFCMGDGGVYYSGKECRFISNMVVDNYDYVSWKKSILENITSVNEYISQQTGKKDIVCLQTRMHPFFTKIRERLYIDNIKRIDPHYLKLMDWESLSVLYMDDGGIYQDKRCNATPTVSLYTKRFSYGDTLLLKESIKNKLGLEFNINRQKNNSGSFYYFLRLRTKDYNHFYRNIKDFIFPSFSYKIIQND